MLVKNIVNTFSVASTEYDVFFSTLRYLISEEYLKCKNTFIDKNSNSRTVITYNFFFFKSFNNF